MLVTIGNTTNTSTASTSNTTHSSYYTYSNISNAFQVVTNVSPISEVIFTSDAFTSQYYYLKEKINWEKFYGIL